MYEQAILKIEPSDGLATYLHRRVNEIYQQEKQGKTSTFLNQV